MKKKLLYYLLTVVCFTAMQSCLFGNTSYPILLLEIRTETINTNIIGIVGETSMEPYVEIRYSAADEENPGFNKTVTIMVSPPYIFQNDTVYMTYEYKEWGDGHELYSKRLIHNYTEGGAEYLRIINHSPDKPVEFFIAGAPIKPHVSPYYDGYVPQISYNKTPVYFLLFPEEKNNKIWSVNEVADLYRLEYERSSEVQLTITFFEDDYRLIDLINGKIDTAREFRGAVYYGTIQPGDALHGDDKIWLLVVAGLGFDEFEWGYL